MQVLNKVGATAYCKHCGHIDAVNETLCVLTKGE